MRGNVLEFGRGEEKYGERHGDVEEVREVRKNVEKILVKFVGVWQRWEKCGKGVGMREEVRGSQGKTRRKLWGSVLGCGGEVGEDKRRGVGKCEKM